MRKQKKGSYSKQNGADSYFSELPANDITFLERKINVCVIKFIPCLNVNKAKKFICIHGFVEVVIM